MINIEIIVHQTFAILCGLVLICVTGVYAEGLIVPTGGVEFENAEDVICDVDVVCGSNDEGVDDTEAEGVDDTEAEDADEVETEGVIEEPNDE